jgi:hypothetical protein
MLFHSLLIQDGCSACLRRHGGRQIPAAQGGRSGSSSEEAVMTMHTCNSDELALLGKVALIGRSWQQSTVVNPSSLAAVIIDWQGTSHVACHAACALYVTNWAFFCQ